MAFLEKAIATSDSLASRRREGHVWAQGPQTHEKGNHGGLSGYGSTYGLPNEGLDGQQIILSYPVLPSAWARWGLKGAPGSPLCGDPASSLF